MLYSASIIEEVVRSLKRHPGVLMVVDPVMISTSGAKLLEPRALKVLREKLLPLAVLVTPNLDEAAVLSDLKWVEATLLAFERARGANVPTVADVDIAGHDLMLVLLSLSDYAIFPAQALEDAFPDGNLEEKLGRALEKATLSLAPTRIRFFSGLSRDRATATAFRVPIEQPEDALRAPTLAPNHLWRNSAGLTWQPAILATDDARHFYPRRHNSSDHTILLATISRRSGIVGAEVRGTALSVECQCVVNRSFIPVPHNIGKGDDPRDIEQYGQICRVRATADDGDIGVSGGWGPS